MKKIEHIIYSDKIKREENIAVLSDVHFNSATTNDKLEDIIDTVKKIEPSHIVIPGNFFDASPGVTTYSRSENGNLERFIDSLSRISDMVYVLGESEYSSLKDPNHESWPRCFTNPESLPSNFFIPNMFDSPEIKTLVDPNNITISGINLAKNVYSLDQEQKLNAINAIHEMQLKSLFENQFDSSKFNILICHDSAILKIIKQYLETYRNKSVDMLISALGRDGVYPITSKQDSMIVSKGIIKYKDAGEFKKIDKFHKGAIENIKVRRR